MIVNDQSKPRVLLSLQSKTQAVEAQLPQPQHNAKKKDVAGYLPFNSTSFRFFMKQSFPVFMGWFNNFNSKILVYIKEKCYDLKGY